MTDSLNENVPKNNDQPAVESDSAKERVFWNDEPSQERTERRFKNTYVPSWIKKQEEAENGGGSDSSPWLGLSHLVDEGSLEGGQPDAGDLASRYPKAQGGNVVMRGPVEGEARQEQQDEEPLNSPGFNGISAHYPISDDLEEPKLVQDGDSYHDDRYLPEDVYTEENPFDVISVEEKPEDKPKKRLGGWLKHKFGHASKSVWQDVEFEVVEGDSNGASGEQEEAVQEVLPISDEQDLPEDELMEDELLEDEPLDDDLIEGELLEDEPLDDELLEDELLEDEPTLQPEVKTEFEDLGVQEPLANINTISVPDIDAAELEVVPQVDVEFSPAPEEKKDELKLPDDPNMNRWARLAWRIKHNYRHARTIAIVVVVVVILFVVYVVGIFVVSGKFLPNSSIGDCDVSGMTVEEATEALTEHTEKYTLTITSGEFADVVDGESVSADRDEPVVVQEAFSKQPPYIWPYALLFHYDPNIDQGITYDNIKFDEQVTKAVDDYNKSTLPANKVKITLDSGTQMYKLEGGVEGEALEKDVVLESAHQAISSMRMSAKPNKNKAFREAKVSDLPQYQHTIENANAVRNANIPVLVDGVQVAICQPDVLRKWVTVSDQPAVVVDTAAMQAWADSSLSPLVHKDGEWGEMFLDTNVFVDTFAKRLINGETAPVEAVTYAKLSREGESRMQAYEKSPWNKKLGRYIDVDLSAQFARLFDKQGKVLWESAFVSGDMYGGHQTVTGTYEIYAHVPGQVLVGLDYNGDGQPDYESYVNFWMPFYGGYGLHDATWRDEFGGDLYLYNGSHGCINLPYDKTEELYGLVDVGDKVYVHEE